MRYWKNGKSDVEKTRNREREKVAIERKIVREKEKKKGKSLRLNGQI